MLGSVNAWNEKRLFSLFIFFRQDWFKQPCWCFKLHILMRIVCTQSILAFWRPLLLEFHHLQHVPHISSHGVARQAVVTVNNYRPLCLVCCHLWSLSTEETSTTLWVLVLCTEPWKRLYRKGCLNIVTNVCLWIHHYGPLPREFEGDIVVALSIICLFVHRENSPITQTSPEPTLLSWGGGPLEKISPHPWPGLIVLIGPLRPYCSQSPLILLRCVMEIKFAQSLRWFGNWH